MAKVIRLPRAGTAPASDAGFANPGPADEIAYRVAAQLEHVLDAWRLVHDCAVDQGIIARNPFGLHTNAHAASPGSTVFLAERDGRTASTVTATRDGRGLALDATYGRELDRLRKAGNRLVEIGLVAHRSGASGLERLLAIGIDYALRNDFAVVTAVPAHHVGFYCRTFGFSAVECRRSLVPRGRPLSLLHVGRDQLSSLHGLPKGLKALSERPVRASFYAGAFSFLASQTAGSVLDGYFAAASTPIAVAAR